MSSARRGWAIVAYLAFPVGPLAVLIFHKQEDYIRMGARQAVWIALAALGVLVVWAAGGWVISMVPYYGFILAVALFAMVIGAYLFLFVLWAIGLANLARTETRPIPVVGSFVERHLRGPGARAEKVR